MRLKNEQLMIIQALGTCICRKRQKNNRRMRKLQEAEENKETGLHQLRRAIYKVFEEIADLELLKERLENEFDTNKQENDNPWRRIELGTDLPKERGDIWVVCQGKVFHYPDFDPEIEMSVRYCVDHYSYWKKYFKPEFNPNEKL